MKTTTLRKGERMTDLIERLYDPGVDRQAAEKRLIKANPHLRELSKAREGVLVLVPELKGKKTKKISGEPTSPVNEVLDSLSGLLQAARADFERSSQKQMAELKASQKSFKEESFKEAAGRNPELKDRMPEVENRLKERAEAIREFKAAHRTSLKDLDGHLHTLTEVVKLGSKPRVPVEGVSADPRQEPARRRESQRKEETKEAAPTLRSGGRYRRVAYHITYSRDENHWRVLEAGQSDPLSVHGTKKEAVDRGRKIAQGNQPSQIFIHKQDGEIQEERTYGDDPPETKG